MLSHTLRSLIGICGALAMFLPAPVEAQIVRRYPGGGVHVRAPFVRVDVGPYGHTSVRAPFVAVDPGSVQIGIRRRFAPLPQYAAQPPAGYVPFPTAEQLAMMDEQALFTALRDLTYALDARLSRLTTGAGWQRYLRISDSVLRDPLANLEKLEHALVRYESVADNPEYAKIAGLPSFIATKIALRQVVGRFAGPGIVEPSGPDLRSPAIAPSGDEVLPTPATPAKPKASQGEHSILK